MKHQHPMPIPTNVKDLRKWMLGTAQQAGKTPDLQTQRLIETAMATVGPDGMAEFTAGFVYCCPACQIAPGERVRISNKRHPWYGETGRMTNERMGHHGHQYKVELDNGYGSGCFVTELTRL
jgi:hypothetical protein